MPVLDSLPWTSTVSRDEQAAEAEAAIDQALDLLYSEWHHLASRLSVECATPLDRQKLRAGPLGRDLRRLAAIARGEETTAPETILRAVEAVLQLLFWPAGGHRFTIPRGFWTTDLGIMLNRAQGRAYEASDANREPSMRSSVIDRLALYQPADSRGAGAWSDAGANAFFAQPKGQVQVAESTWPGMAT